MIKILKITLEFFIINISANKKFVAMLETKNIPLNPPSKGDLKTNSLLDFHFEGGLRNKQFVRLSL